MRMVSPMPSASSMPRPIDDLTAPARSPPASVMPRCSGASVSVASLRKACTVMKTSDALRLTL